MPPLSRLSIVRESEKDIAVSLDWYRASGWRFGSGRKDRGGIADMSSSRVRSLSVHKARPARWMFRSRSNCGGLRVGEVCSAAETRENLGAGFGQHCAADFVLAPCFRGGESPSSAPMRVSEERRAPVGAPAADATGRAGSAGG